MAPAPVVPRAPPSAKAPPISVPIKPKLAKLTFDTFETGPDESPSAPPNTPLTAISAQELDMQMQALQEKMVSAVTASAWVAR